ncbi:putative ribonuclease H-like domain-containing protein [Tanacetum coccineum]
MRNKSNLDTLSMDDLYNNLKVYESEIKVQSSSSSNSQNVAFISSKNTSSTNEAVNTVHEVSTTSSWRQASSSTYVDDVMFSFFTNQSNSPQLDNEDLEQIDTDDLEEMDLKWQVAMLTMRVKKFLKKTERNLNFNGKETVGFDKTNVECYNCHRRGHFARECRAPRNQENRNGDGPRRNAPVDTSTTNALVVQDGIGGYDWSFQAEEGITNFALMAYTSQGSSSSSSSDSEREALNKSNLEIIGYQMGLESLEARIVVHEKNEAVYEEDIAFLKYDVQVKDISIKDLKNQLEEALKEKDDLKLKLEKFEESSKNLTKLINSQISAKDKAGLGYDSQINKNEVENIHRQVEYPRKSQSPRDNRRNWNGLMTQKLGNGFKCIKKACFVCGSFNNLIKDCDFHDKKMVENPVLNNKGRVTRQREIKPVWNNAQRVNHQNKFTHPHPKRNFVPTAVVTKSGQVRVNNAKQSSPRVAASIIKRDFNQKSAAKTNKFNEKANTARVNNVTTAGPKAVVSAAMGNGENTVKSLACCIWRPTGNVIDHTSKDSGSYMLKRFDHIDGGFVAFGGSPKGDKITGKGKIRTGKLDFEDVYFVKELKFNLFSISQMCDKKNTFLFTKTECLVLSPDFKLLDERQVLLKVPR